jgi:hypothetical protein
MALPQSAVSELLDAFRAGNGVDLIRDAVRLVLQELVEIEATERIGAARYERTDTRVTERNGARLRALSTQAGDVELRIPKLRKGSFFPAILEPRRRIDKAMLMAAVSFVSFVPMLIVLAAIFPLRQIHNFRGTLQAAMALDDNAAKALHTLFGSAGRVAGTTTVGSLAIVIISGYAFVANLQQTYELIWRRRRARRIQSFVRRWIWLGGFLGFGLVLALIHGTLGRGGTASQVSINVFGFVVACFFFTWSLHLLLGGRVRWLEVAGAV